MRIAVKCIKNSYDLYDRKKYFSKNKYYYCNIFSGEIVTINDNNEIHWLGNKRSKWFNKHFEIMHSYYFICKLEKI